MLSHSNMERTQIMALWPTSDWKISCSWYYGLNLYMEVSQNGGFPKRMVYNGTSYFFMDDLGENHFRNPPYVLLL